MVIFNAYRMFIILLSIFLLASPAFSLVSVNWTNKKVVVVVRNDKKDTVLCSGPIFVRSGKWLHIEDVNRLFGPGVSKTYSYKYTEEVLNAWSKIECR